MEQTQAIDLSEMQAEAMAPEIEMDTGLDMAPAASEEPEIVSDEELGGLEFNLDIGSTDQPAEAEPEAGTELSMGGGESLEFEPSGVPLSGSEEAETPSTEEELSFGGEEISMDVAEESGGLSLDEEDDFASLRDNTAENNEADMSISIDTGEGTPELVGGDLGISLDTSDTGVSESDTDLDLSMGGAEEEDVAVAVAPEVEEVGAGAGDADQWDEAATKLDLAKAYIDMGDAEGAKSILEEVATEGNEDQQRQAAELAGQIG